MLISEEESMGRGYYLHRRAGVWYAELVDQATGRKLTARSTGTQNRDEAILKVAEWRKDGIPTGRMRKPRPIDLAADIESILRAIRKADLFSEDAMRIVDALKDRGLIDVVATKTGPGSILFTEYLETFWDFQASSYVRERLAHKQGITRRHCYEMGHRVRKYWLPAFNGRTLNSITRQDLKDFSLSLAEKGLAPASINKIMACGIVALKWAFSEEELIVIDPTARLKRFGGGAKTRGILTPQEAATIFNKISWRDKRAYVGNLLAATSGMRSGEVLALRKNDIGDKFLNVEHSYSTFDGLKSTKTNEKRKATLFAEVRVQLMELLAENPHKVDNPFVFYGLYENQPMDNKILLKGLREACATAGIPYKERGISYHSHRHFWSTVMAPHLKAEKLRQATGHKTQIFEQLYANHELAENLDEVWAVGAEVFGNILQFPKAV
jgi:integrase